MLFKINRINKLVTNCKTFSPLFCKNVMVGPSKETIFKKESDREIRDFFEG